MENKTYKKIIVFVIMLLISQYVYCAGSCRSGLNCKDRKCRCVEICNSNKREKECIKSLSDVKSPKMVRKICDFDMPTCINFDYSTFPGSYSYYSPKVIMDVDGIKDDVANALKEWNCLCDLENEPCKNMVKTIFTDDKTRFVWEERTWVAAASTSWDMDDCCIHPERSLIEFNNTSFFRYQDKGDVHPGPPKWSVINKKYEHLLPSISSDGRFFSFYDVLLHELGHIFGFLHLEDCGKPEESSSIMANITYPNTPSKGLNNDDKCMFIQLYCPYISVYDYQPQTQKIYPNPGSYVVAIDFELPRYAENFKMYVNDVLGQTRLILIEDAVYDAGEHTVLINLDTLPVGTYHIIIEAGSYRTAQPIYCN